MAIINIDYYNNLAQSNTQRKQSKPVHPQDNNDANNILYKKSCDFVRSAALDSYNTLLQLYDTCLRDIDNGNIDNAVNRASEFTQQYENPNSGSVFVCDDGIYQINHILAHFISENKQTDVDMIQMLSTAIEELRSVIEHIQGDDKYSAEDV